MQARTLSAITARAAGILLLASLLASCRGGLKVEQFGSVPPNSGDRWCLLHGRIGEGAPSPAPKPSSEVTNCLLSTIGNLGPGTEGHLSALGFTCAANPTSLGGRACVLRYSHRVYTDWEMPLLPSPNRFNQTDVVVRLEYKDDRITYLTLQRDFYSGDTKRPGYTENHIFEQTVNLVG